MHGFNIPYGRLEVFDGFAFSGIAVRGETDTGGLGRNAAVVACRSIGFADGAQITAGSTSALPGAAGAVQTISQITCQGDEATLGQCEIETGADYDAESEDGQESVAVICSTPSGAPPSAPVLL